MALATQDGVIVWQKVAKMLVGANPASAAAFRDLKNYITTQGGNPSLQVVPVDGTYSSSDGGNNASQVLMDAACTIYAVYLKKSGATETVFKGSNNTTTAATDGTQKYAISKLGSGDVCEIFPTGDVLSTGLTVTENTARTTSTLTLKANKMDGFVILGA